MLNITFEKTHTDRIDVNKTIKASFNIPGHRDRLKAHCERVQREYFDSGLYHKETHPAEEKKHKLLMRDGRSHD